MIYLKRDTINKVILRLNDKGFDKGALEYYKVYFIMSIKSVVGAVNQEGIKYTNVLLDGVYPSNMYCLFDIYQGEGGVDLDSGQYSASIFMLYYGLEEDEEVIEGELDLITGSNIELNENEPFSDLLVRYEKIYSDMLIIELRKQRANNPNNKNIYY